MILFIRLLSSSKRRSVATADDVQVVMCAADREAIVGAAWSLPFILCSGCYHATAAAVLLIVADSCIVLHVQCN